MLEPNRLDCKSKLRSTLEERLDHRFYRGKGGVTELGSGYYLAEVHCSCGVVLRHQAQGIDEATDGAFKVYHEHRRIMLNYKENTGNVAN